MNTVVSGEPFKEMGEGKKKIFNWLRARGGIIHHDLRTLFCGLVFSVNWLVPKMD